MTLNDGIARLQTIEWADRTPMDPEGTFACLQKFRRAASRVADHFGVGEGTIFTSFASEFAGDPLPPGVLLELERIGARVPPMRGQSYVIRALEEYLRWCVVLEAFPEFEDVWGNPLEPLIQYFEQGGMFEVEHGMFLQDNATRAVINIRLESKVGKSPESGHLDAMCIPMEKVEETAEYAEYEFRSGWWVKDPDRRGRFKLLYMRAGRVRISKESLEMEVISPIPEDLKGRVTCRALGKLREHALKGEYPLRTGFYSG